MTPAGRIEAASREGIGEIRERARGASCGDDRTPTERDSPDERDERDERENECGAGDR